MSRLFPLAASLATAFSLAACSSGGPPTLDPPESEPRYDGFVGAGSHGVALAAANLDQLTRSANAVYYGTVVSKSRESVELGGAAATATRYRFAVTSTFKGNHVGERDMLVVDSPVDSRGEPLLQGIPSFELDRQYVVFAGRPGPSGLSAPIGLGQGVFAVRGDADARHLINDYDNRGLYAGIGTVPRTGPVPFHELTSRVEALAAKEARHDR